MVVALASPTAVVAQVACLRLLVQCVELPGERRVVIGEGADLRLIGVLPARALSMSVLVSTPVSFIGPPSSRWLSVRAPRGTLRTDTSGVSLLAVLEAVWRLVTRVRERSCSPATPAKPATPAP